MARTAVEIDPQLIAFMLPSIPESVPIARFHIRAALSFHQLDEYADDAAIITSELVTNAIQHVRGDGTGTVGVTLARTRTEGPVTRTTPDGSERGRGLRIVDELSDCWGWNPEDGGKAVYAVLAKQAGA